MSEAADEFQRLADPNCLHCQMMVQISEFGRKNEGCAHVVFDALAKCVAEMIHLAPIGTKARFTNYFCDRLSEQLGLDQAGGEARPN